MTTTGVFSKELNGLPPGTTYHFRAKAVSGDKTTYGEGKTFTTSGPPIGEVTFALDNAISSIAEEKPKGFNVAPAEDLLAQAQQAYQNEAYQTALELASKASKLAVDIDQDGVLNENDFAPTVKNIYIYAGASVFALVLIVSTSLGATWYIRKRRVVRERIEKEKAEIIDMIDKSLNDKGRK